MKERLLDTQFQFDEAQMNPIEVAQVRSSEMVQETRDNIIAEQVEARAEVEPPKLIPETQQPLAGYEASVEQAAEVDKRPENPGQIELTSGDDYLPYLADIENNYDLTEQAYQDKQEGITREVGDVSNKYLLPNRKTVRGIDVATGQRILNRGNFENQEAMKKYEEGVQMLGEASFNVNHGYDARGLQGLSRIAAGIIQEDESYAEYRKAIDLMGVPPEQAKLAWDAANAQAIQRDIAEYIVSDFDDSAYAEVADATAPAPTGEVIEETDLPPIQIEDLPNQEGWADSMRRIYEAEEMAPFEGTDAELTEYYIDMMSSFNWKIGIPDNMEGVPGINAEGMAYYMVQAMKRGPEYAQDLLTLVDMYERVPTNLSIIGKNIAQMATDPVNLVTIPGGGTLAMKIGGKIAANRMKNALTKMIVAGAGAGAIEGSVFAAGDQAMMQTIEQEAGYREEYDPAAIAKAGAAGFGVGAGLGAGLGVGIPVGVAAARRAGRAMYENGKRSQSMSPMRAQLGAVGNLEGRIPFKRKIKDDPRYPVDEALKVNDLEASFKLADENHFPTKIHLKKELERNAAKARADSGIDMRESNPQTDKILVGMFLNDAKKALESNSNAIGWYDRTVGKAMGILELIHPELKTDPDANTAFKYILAVTSNGMRVDRNFHLAEKAYQQYKKTGYMPTNIGEGKQGDAMNKHAKLFNQMKDEIGVSGIRDLFDQKFTVKELKEMGYSKVSGYVTDEVYGAAIIGPKIGNGFYANLNGKFDQLTMDLWLRRTLGRYTGELIADRPDMVAKKITELSEFLNEATPEDIARIETVTGKLSWDTDEQVKQASKQIAKATMLPENRDVFNETPIGQSIRKSGNGLDGWIDKEMDAPTAKERQRTTIAMREALTALQEDYPQLTMADFQALLWYPEKLLYDKAYSKTDKVADGYADNDAPDYANAAEAMALEMGIDPKLIEEVKADVDKSRAVRAGQPEGEGGTELQGDSPDVETQGAAAGDPDGLAFDPASQRTQVPNTESTYARTGDLMKKLKLKGKTLDWGAGLGLGSKHIGKADAYEPFPKEGFEPKFSGTDASVIPDESYDNIVSMNVLNVLKPDVREYAVRNMARVLKPGGTAIIGVRDKSMLKDLLKRGVASELEENAVTTSDGTYQRGFSARELADYIEEILGGGYEVSTDINNMKASDGKSLSPSTVRIKKL